MSSLGYEDEEQMLSDLYVNQQLSEHQIAIKLGVTRSVVWFRMKTYQIPKRKAGGGLNNFKSKDRDKLKEMDQKVVFETPVSELSRMTGVSRHIIILYKEENEHETG